MTGATKIHPEGHMSNADDVGGGGDRRGGRVMVMIINKNEHLTIFQFRRPKGTLSQKQSFRKIKWEDQTKL